MPKFPIGTKLLVEFTVTGQNQLLPMLTKCQYRHNEADNDPNWPNGTGSFSIVESSPAIVGVKYPESVGEDDFYDPTPEEDTDFI
jgi:hypothetical protein